MSEETLSRTKKEKKQPVKTPKHQVRLLDVRSDLVFKRIFGEHPNLTKSFLNSILPLPENNLIETVSYLTPEQAPRIPSLKNTIVDVKCTDQQGRIFIVEMQLAWTASFAKRFLFGVSKAFVQQLKRGKTYDELCPVYGLAILNEPFDKMMPDWYHHYRLTNASNTEKTLDGIELIFVELTKFKPQTFDHRKIGVLWLRFLREINEKLSDIPQEFKDDPDLAEALELAKESSYTPEELDAYDQYLDAVRVEQTIREDAKAEGEQIGLEKGKAEGKAAGKGEKAIEVAKKLLKKGINLNEVAELTGLDAADLAKL